MKYSFPFRGTDVRRAGLLMGCLWMLLGAPSFSTFAAEGPPITKRLDHPAYYPHPGQVWTSHRGQAHWGGRPQYGWRTYESFALPASEILAGIRWQMSVWDYVTNSKNPVESTIQEWELTIYEDADGEPGKVLYSEQLTEEALTMTVLPNIELERRGIEVPVFDYEWTLAQSLALEAGKTYWFSPLSRGPNFNPIAIWLPGTAPGNPYRRESTSLANDHGSCLQNGVDSNSQTAFLVRKGDRTLTLLGYPANDADGDGMDDAWEQGHGLNVALNDADGDADEDGMSNLREFEVQTDPLDPDTDGDGLLDGVETLDGRFVNLEQRGTDPRKVDTDDDGLPDGMEVPLAIHTEILDNLPARTNPNIADTDGDDYADTLELANGFDPVDPGSHPPLVSLGTGTEALLGHDLTDPENDGDPEGEAGYNAVFASSAEEGFATSGAYSVFDNQLGRKEDDWCCADAEEGPFWVEATFAEPIVLSHFTIASARTNSRRDPGYFEIQGSHDGIHYEPIFFRENHGETIFSKRSEVIRFDAGLHYETPAPYSTIRFISFGTKTLDGPAFNLGELEFFGAPFALEVAEVFIDEAQLLNLTWNAIPGEQYRIEASHDLINWTEMARNLRSEGSVSHYRGPVPGEGIGGYYRVLEQWPLADGFEADESGWISETLAGETEWEHGVPAIEGLAHAAAGRYAWGTNLDGEFSPGVVATLRSPLIDLTQTESSASLRFDHYLDTEAGVEGGQVRFLDENGEVLAEHETPFTGSTEEWTSVRLALPDSVQRRKFRVEFRFLSNADDRVGAGWYIDNVSVK